MVLAVNFAGRLICRFAGTLHHQSRSRQGGTQVLNLVERCKGTIYEGLALHERPAQGVSPFPYLSLSELIELCSKPYPPFQGGRPDRAQKVGAARSAEGARTAPTSGGRSEIADRQLGLFDPEKLYVLVTRKVSLTPETFKTIPERGIGS